MKCVIERMLFNGEPKLIKQVGRSCALAALCAIDSRLSYESMIDEYLEFRDSLDTNMSIERFLDYFEKIAPWYVEGMKSLYAPDLSGDRTGIVDKESTNLSGEGIVIIRNSYGRHAVAYSNGLIYDSNKADLGPMTLDRCLEIYDKEYDTITEVEKVIPKPRSDEP
jgi:hypothetical protein